MMLNIFRKKQSPLYLGDTVSSSKIDYVMSLKMEADDKDRYLDIGTGNDEAERFTTVDIDTGVGADIVGDIRCLFAASDYYRDKRKDYPDLDIIASGRYIVVRLKHIIEHIEWIYHQTMFEWLYGIIAPGGIAVIDTPNLDYIVKLYSKAAGLAGEQRPFKFPANEYNGLKNGSWVDLIRWTQFKLFSGCSPGDFHHACLNRVILFHYLSSVGFEPVAFCNDETLRAIAYKPTQDSDDMDARIDKYVKGE